MFHLDMPGKNNNDLQLEKILFIKITLLVSYFDISGKDFKDLQLSNI